MKFECDENGNLLKFNQSPRSGNIVIIPNGIKQINSKAFNNAKYLKKIIVPNSVERIEGAAFKGNFTINRIKLPKYLKRIEGYLFDGCRMLKKIKIPQSVEVIEKYAFNDCKSLKKISIPTSVKSIANGAFSYSGLRNIEIPDSVIEIEKESFFNCQKLNNIKLPENLKKIDKSVFSNCHKLKKVIMPCNLEEIAEYAFIHCDDLKNINFPESLKSIGNSAFYGCVNLEKIILPANLENIRTYAFHNCKNLREIKLGNIFQLNETGIIDFRFDKVFCNKYGELLLVKGEKTILNDEYEEINYNDVAKKYGCSSNIAILISVLFDENDIKGMGKMSRILPNIVENMNRNNYEILLKCFENNKEFKNIIKSMERNRNSFYRLGWEENLYDIFRLPYSLGVFNEDNIERQKASEFIINAFDKDYLIYDFIHQELEAINLNSYNKEWAEFFMNKDNFKELIKLEREDLRYRGIISRIANDFENVREFGRSNRGEQHYRKVTINMVKEYFGKARFTGIDESNVDIANAIYGYTHKQESFEKAIKIREEYLNLKKENKINDHLLEEELKEIRKEIVVEIKDSLLNLSETSENKFTYEFLSKYDPNNFVLGKYCCCCAHIEGQGSGIMKASILHPDCQNLIIRDVNDRIVAKSTLYINRKQGYGVFNNVEVDRKYMKEAYYIYEKYIEAIKRFVSKYNEKNKDNPLNQINVGMNLNDLGKYLIENNERSDVILEGINFSCFGGYKGDWQKAQYIVFKNK